MSFAETILNFRVKFRLNQSDAAGILGTTQQLISEYESGKHEPRKLRRIIFENKIKEYEEKQKGAE